MPETLTLADAAATTERVVDALRRGQLVVLPTDTVYAVIADAFQVTATHRVFTAKERGPEIPLSLLLRNPRQVIGLATEVPETAERLMAAYWPGPLSIVLTSQPDMPWDLGHTRGTVALRMPADDFLLDVAAEIGPLACSGANLAGKMPAASVAEAQAQLGDAVEVYVDGGARPYPTSTIVDCSRGGAEVLREGSVRSDDVRRVAEGDVGWGYRPAAPHATPDGSDELDDHDLDGGGDDDDFPDDPFDEIDDDEEPEQ